MFGSFGDTSTRSTSGRRAAHNVDDFIVAGLICCGLMITGLVLVGGHVSRQMMPLAECLLADGTSQLLLALAAIRIAGHLALVVRTHVVHQIAGHAEADVALGTHILSGQREGGRQCGWDKGGENRSRGRIL